MESIPTVSVIIPVFNLEKYVETCLHSICRQTYSNYEVIVVNDGSTDKSLDIIEKIAYDNPNIIILNQENKGVSAARNKGLNIARGEFVTFIDGDDWVENNLLKHLTDEIDVKKADLIVSGIEHNYPNGDKETYSFPLQKSIRIESIHTKDFIDHIGLFYGPCAKLYKMGIIRDNNIHFPIDCSLGEDLIFNFEYLRYVNNITGIPYTDYHYRKHRNDTLSTKYRKSRFKIDLGQWKIQKDFLYERAMWTPYSQQFLYTKLWGIIYNGIFSQKELTIKQLKEILKIDEISEINYWKDSFDCSSWIKELIIRRNWLLLYLLLKIRKNN